MAPPVDITDPKLAKAYAHPLRIHILELLDGRVASPRELAGELGAPLSNTSYHVRQLVSFGLVELVGRNARRGAIEHYYTTKVRPTISDNEWGRLPTIVKRTVLLGGIKKAIREMALAAEQGGFDREDMHYTRTTGRLDRKAWAEVSRELRETFERIDRIAEESDARAADDPEAEPSTIIMIHFAGPKTALDNSAEADDEDGGLYAVEGDLPGEARS
jgi:DNA-binding transcriptional ArsR family regulator